MKILVTAGNTQTLIDRVRCITNVFSGRTGAQIADVAFDRGHVVTLLTSHPEVIGSLPTKRTRQAPDWKVHGYRTFEELETRMAEAITSGEFDAVIHAAAVSDYRVTGMYAPAAGTIFDPKPRNWRAGTDEPRMVDANAGKVKSHHPELWLRLQPAPKLVDKIRSIWGFRGVLVKFKLEVEITDAELLNVSEQARLQSDADLMVANTLEGMHDWAYVGAGIAGYRRVLRNELAERLIDEVCRYSLSTRRQGATPHILTAATHARPADSR